MKLPMGVFDGAAPPVAPVLFSAPVPVQVRGSVGGLVPWHRLAVAVFWLEFRPGKSADFRIDGPLTLVQPDRSYSLVAPPQRHHVLLFDVLTGVALEWHEVVPTAARSLVVDFRGLAVPVDVTLEVTANRALGNPMRVMYEPTVDHWPGGIGMLAETRAGRGLRQGMRFDARAGEKHTFWLRERSGKLGIDSYPAIDLADTVGPIVLSTSH